VKANGQAPQYLIVRLPAPGENSRIFVSAEVDEETEELTWIPVRGTYDPVTGLLTAAVGLGLFQPVEENGVAAQKSTLTLQGAGSTTYNGHVGVGVGGQQFNAQIVFNAVEPTAALEVPFQGPPIPVRGLVGARLSNITDPPLDPLVVRSPFGPRTHPVTGVRNKPHKGVDYQAVDGTTVYAAGDGEVTGVLWQDANNRGAGAGYYVTIDHGNGEVTRYFHLMDPGVGPTGPIMSTPGCTGLGVCVGTPDNPTRVSAGQPISYSDTTGRVTGPHLHFEVLQNGVPIDPQLIFGATVTATIAMALDYEVQAGTEQQIPLTRREVITPEEMTEYVNVVELTDVAPGEHRLQFVIVEPSGTLEVLAAVPLTVGEPFLGLTGAELWFRDVTTYFPPPTDAGIGRTWHATERREIVYSLVAIDESRLQGQAHLTFFTFFEDSMPGSSCPTTTYSVGPLEWDVFLEGTYQIDTDGVIDVHFDVTPTSGPDYTINWTNPGCSYLDTSDLIPGYYWAETSGTLVNGRYDYRFDTELQSDESGEEYYESHMRWTTPP
jgi:murein DD-endopeptidase MepM/ murein hydrolase activator NlpD